jgi:hypothetical protein
VTTEESSVLYVCAFFPALVIFLSLHKERCFVIMSYVTSCVLLGLVMPEHVGGMALGKAVMPCQAAEFPRQWGLWGSFGPGGPGLKRAVPFTVLSDVQIVFMAHIPVVGNKGRSMDPA